MENFAWRKSSRCETGACVEVAFTAATVAVRDSKNAATTGGPVLHFSREEWAEFISAVKAGEMELPPETASANVGATGNDNQQNLVD